jgi:hypothetical protein
MEGQLDVVGVGPGARHSMRDHLSLALRLVGWIAQGYGLESRGLGNRPISLLDDVGQLMGQSTPAGIRLWRVLTGPENNIVSHCVGQRVDSPCRFSRSPVRVNPDVSEVEAEAGLQEVAGGFAKRLAG